MSDETEHSANTDLIPTKELLKKQRQADYLKAKASRKALREKEKLAKSKAKTEARAERDQELWRLLKPARDHNNEHASERDLEKDNTSSPDQ